MLSTSLLACLSVAGVLLVPGTHSAATVEQLQYLFDRPAEPIFLPKRRENSNKQAVFDVPENYLTERQKEIGTRVINRFGEDSERIKVPAITVPDLSVPAQLGKREQFSLFIPEHQMLAGRLIQIFLAMRSLDELLSVAVYARNRLNPHLYMYAYSVAMLHRNDTQQVDLPLYCQLFPEKFVDGSMFADAREETLLPPERRNVVTINKDYTASDLDEEHKVAYFREDLGINLHHWHWHLVYPTQGPMEVVDKDRRGELFSYMHQQILARYNMERFSNRLQRVKRLANLQEPIPEGYFPKLTSLTASRVWPSRTANTKLSDINRRTDNERPIKFDLRDLDRWNDRIQEAVQTGVVERADGSRANLTVDKGIDMLGNMVEASALSPNFNLYGNLHNFGHLAIAFSHDPDYRHLESFGVMGESSTAMRDPVFYRWHAYVDEIFQKHRAGLPPYTPAELDFPGVRVKGLEVMTQGARRPNELFTYWQQSDVDVSRGLDFMERGPMVVRFTHLQHRPFAYRLQVESQGPASGYVRLFMAPKLDERGVAMPFRDQRHFMVELDKFPVTLNPRSNAVERASTKSSVTLPFERTFRNLAQGGVSPNTTADPSESFNFCGCGWPHHMLIPKGTPEGLVVQLFAMVTDYTKDKVEQPANSRCSKATSYCGLRGQRYPDKRAMGFPFNREARPGTDTLRAFLTPNMYVADVTIRFQDRVEAPAARNVGVLTGRTKSTS